MGKYIFLSGTKKFMLQQFVPTPCGLWLEKGTVLEAIIWSHCLHFRIQHPSSLRLDLSILLDVYMIICLKCANFVFRKLDTGRYYVRHLSQKPDASETYVKPLIKVNSCLISPPEDLACSFALVSSSGEAFSFNVTWKI